MKNPNTMGLAMDILNGTNETRVELIELLYVILKDKYEIALTKFPDEYAYVYGESIPYRFTEDGVRLLKHDLPSPKRKIFERDDDFDEYVNDALRTMKLRTPQKDPKTPESPDAMVASPDSFRKYLLTNMSPVPAGFLIDRSGSPIRFSLEDSPVAAAAAPKSLFSNYEKYITAETDL